MVWIVEGVSSSCFGVVMRTACWLITYSVDEVTDIIYMCVCVYGCLCVYFQVLPAQMAVV